MKIKFLMEWRVSVKRELEAILHPRLTNNNETVGYGPELQIKHPNLKISSFRKRLLATGLYLMEITFNP
jgi:hypothetical protein